VTDLVIEDVSLHFGGIRALDGVSLTVPRGAVCGLIGPNGAGKTTLINCISGIHRADSGEILFDGVDLVKLRAHRVAGHGVARTFQNLGLFPSMSFLDNVLAGAHSVGRVGYWRAALRVGVRAEERRLRAEATGLLRLLELDHLADVPAAGQPFGTLKRLEIARALAARPRLLLLDEPAGGLTRSEVDELGDVIRRVRDEHDLTVVLVEHHMPMIMKISELVVAMSSGRTIAQGAPGAVRDHPEVRAAYLGTEPVG
jgi:branched-chain amino acid transport system ATP-binding protein